MKKVASIFAVVLMGLGMYSCTPDSSVAETQDLYTVKATADDTGCGGGDEAGCDTIGRE